MFQEVMRATGSDTHLPLTCVARFPTGHGLVLVHNSGFGEPWNKVYKCYIRVDVFKIWGFPGSSADKGSTGKAGDPGLIPGLGKSPGEGIGYPLQYSWASLVAQMIKNLPAMWKTWVLSLVGKSPGGGACPILAWRIPMDREAWRSTVHGVTKSQTRLSD